MLHFFLKKKKLHHIIRVKFKFLKINLKYSTQDLAVSMFFINRNYYSFFNETIKIIKSINYREIPTDSVNDFHSQSLC